MEGKHLPAMRTTATELFPMSSRPFAFHDAMSDSAESRMEAVAESGRGSTTCVSAAGGGERASLVTCYGGNQLSVTLMI